MPASGETVKRRSAEPRDGGRGRPARRRISSRLSDSSIVSSMYSRSTPAPARRASTTARRPQMAELLGAASRAVRLPGRGRGAFAAGVERPRLGEPPLGAVLRFRGRAASARGRGSPLRRVGMPAGASRSRPGSAPRRSRSTRRPPRGRAVTASGWSSRSSPRTGPQ